jgi:hypothetical protein
MPLNDATRTKQDALSPITSSTTKVSATTAKEQHQYNDNQDQFHGTSPRMMLALVATQRVL